MISIKINWINILKITLIRMKIKLIKKKTLKTSKIMLKLTWSSKTLTKIKSCHQIKEKRMMKKNNNSWKALMISCLSVLKINKIFNNNSNNNRKWKLENIKKGEIKKKEIILKIPYLPQCNQLKSTKWLIKLLLRKRKNTEKLKKPKMLLNNLLVIKLEKYEAWQSIYVYRSL